MRYQLVAPDLVPLFRRRDVRRAERIDAQTDRGTPWNRVLHKLHLLPVIGEEERTRPFQALLGHDFLVGFDIKFGPHRPIRPNDPHDLGPRLLTQAEMNLRSRDRLLLYQQAGADFDFATNAERVDALVAESLCGARSNDLPMIILGSVIDRL